MTPWTREERIRVLRHMHADLTRQAWADRMGVSLHRIRCDYRAIKAGDRVRILRELMAAEDWTAEDVAAYSGRSINVVRHWMSGDTAAPIHTLSSLARRVGLRLRRTYHLEVADEAA